MTFAFDERLQLEAVARRAFGGTPDVRPLLPEYEEAIGRMMAAEVPKPEKTQIDNKGGAKRKAERDERLNMVRGLMLRGNSPKEVGAILGLSYESARRWCREAQKVKP